MKWTKFNNELPEKTLFWVSDYCSVWPMEETNRLIVMGYAQNNPEYAWAEIPIPEAPKEEKQPHRCEKEGILCTDRFFFSISEPMGLAIQYSILQQNGDIDLIRTPVSFCPFCGYEVKHER